MRQVSFLALAVFLAITAWASPSLARGRAPAVEVAPPDLYCLQGRIWGYPGNCAFSNYAQCAATASGTDAYCDVNPQYLFGRQRRAWY